jgi:DNA-binding CsgD family transcriptional regulator
MAGSAVLELLDQLDFGAALVDARGTVVHANAAAGQIFDSGLDVARGQLTADDSRAAAELQRLVEASSRLPFSLAATQPVAVQRSGRRPVVVEAVPLPPSARDPLGVLRAVLLITDLGEARRLCSHSLRTVFRLTKAEARLAARLAGGEDLESAANGLGVKMQTARSSLKTIFGKTETHRQAELVALLSRLGNRYRTDDEPA